MMTRVVLVGAGKVGLKESQALRRHPDYELLAVCDSGRERRSAVAEVTGVPTYDSLSACLSAGVSPDLVQIATPPESHHSIAMQALAAGADVYIEKVMTLRESEAAEIVDTAAKSRLNVYVRRNSLYTPVFRRLLRATGEVGRVKRVTFTNAVSGYDEYEPEKAK
jgi:predicted dehydrogenase